MKHLSLLLALGAAGLLQQPVLGYGEQSQQTSNNTGPKLVSYQPKYKGHALVRFRPEVSMQGLVGNAPIDIWTSLPSGDRVARLTPDQIHTLQRVAKAKGDQGWQVVHENLQDIIDKEAQAINRGILANHPYRRALQGELAPGCLDYDQWFRHYHRYEEIKRFAQQLAIDYPQLVEYIPSIGPQRTWEGRTIFALKITSSIRYTRSKASSFVRHRDRKPQIWLQGTQHAREYISATTVQFLAHHYASRYGHDPTVTSLLDRAQLVLILVANPDGYIHAWDHDRYWRKNKRALGNETYGVDTNRNWDDHWGGGGSSQDPTAENYAGPSPASEPEVQALQSYYTRQGNIIAAIDFHCYAELILRPFGWAPTNISAIHDPELAAAGQGLRQAIHSVHQQDFFNGRMANVGSLAAGSAMDWFYGNSSTSANGGHGRNSTLVRPYAYTIELRPTQAFEDGFRLPEEQIVPAGQEIAAGMDWLIGHALDNPLLEKN